MYLLITNQDGYNFWKKNYLLVILIIDRIIPIKNGVYIDITKTIKFL